MNLKNSTFNIWCISIHGHVLLLSFNMISLHFSIIFFYSFWTIDFFFLHPLFLSFPFHCVAFNLPISPISHNLINRWAAQILHVCRILFVGLHVVLALGTQEGCQLIKIVCILHCFVWILLHVKYFYLPENWTIQENNKYIFDFKKRARNNSYAQINFEYIPPTATTGAGVGWGCCTFKLFICFSCGRLLVAFSCCCCRLFDWFWILWLKLREFRKFPPR